MMKDKKQKYQLKLKIKLYIVSLCLLFLLIFILKIDIPVCFGESCSFIGWTELIKRNWIAILSLIMVLISLKFTRIIKRKDEGTFNPSVKIESIKSENYEYLTFLTTYIIPLICINLNDIRYVIVLVILLILIGYIFIKMNLYYGNPTLAIMGYHLYCATIKDPNIEDKSKDIILISRDELHKNQNVKWIPIDQNVWFAKEV